MIDHTFAVKKMNSLEELFVIFSKYTRMPFVECDEETFDDQVHMFAGEPEAQAFVQKYEEKKTLLMVMKATKEQVRGLYSSFFSIGANAIVFHENDTICRLELKDVMPLPDMEKLNKEKIPMANPTLQLSALYFLQEICRPVKHDMEYTKGLEEEMMVNLLRSRYILPLENATPGQPINPKDRNNRI